MQRTHSDGGAIVGIPAELAAAWRGTELAPGADRDEAVSDYDRSCDALDDEVDMPNGGFGALAVEGGFTLVFLCALATYWIPTSDGGVVVRSGDVASLADGLRSIDAVPAKAWTPWPRTLTLRDGRIFFFAAACEGARNPAEIRAEHGVAIGAPGPGTYSISTAVDRAGYEYVKLARA